MAVPTLKCKINFSTGASFGAAAELGAFILDTNVLGDSTTVIVDVSSRVQAAQTRRGRNPLTDVFQTGTASIQIADQNGDFNPQNPASPYYTLLQPLRKIQLSAIDPATSIEYFLFSGYITGYNYTQSRDTGTVSYTTITAVDGFQLLNLGSVSTVTGAVAGETTGTRIGRILDAVGWPSGMRDVDTGLTTCQVDPGSTRTALSALQTVATTEYGALYMDAAGQVVFQDRNLTAGSVAGTPTVFADDGTGIAYSNLQWVLNDAQIFNEANITATGLAKQTASDATSVANYFLHSYNVTDLLMQTTTEALNYAQAYVASRKDTSIRADSITLDLTTSNYAAGVTAALNLDYFDPVTIKQAQPNATTLQKTFQVFGVAHDIRPGQWKTTFTTLEPIIDSFILNNTNYGVLDTNVLSY
ncbi:MAG: hypothetical protein EBR94_06845 [Bacteroidetes bacterium]|nr:hypothetical protein [Bacteroidota bacterium]